MNKPKNKINISERLLLLRLLDVLFAILGFSVYVYFLNFEDLNKYNAHFFPWMLTLGVYLLLIGQIFEMYRLKVASDQFRIVRSIVLTTFFTTFFYIFTPVIAPELPPKRIYILYLYLAITIPILLWRFAYIFFIFTPKYFKDILILGESQSVSKVIDLIISKAPENHIVGYFTSEKILKYPDIPFFDKKTDELIPIVNLYSVTEIIVTDRLKSVKTNSINQDLVKLFENGIAIKNIENYYEEITSCIPRHHLNEDFYRNISFSKNHEDRMYLALGRLIDIILSIIGLVFLLFLIPFVLVGNLVANRGPLFYKQERIGLKGKAFKIIKFRSMVKNAEENGAVWAVKKDPRVTVFGKFLRKTRFDEIPQFYNILKGEMAFIGPRPERPKFVEELASKINLYRIRHVIKPGLTGWAQVMYPYASSVEEQGKKLRFDLYYIKNRSFYLDFKIVIKTFSTVLFFRGN